MTRLLSFASAISLAATSALAGPLNKSWVARDAGWVAHIDVEAAVASTLGRHVLANREEMDLEGLDEIKAELGIDPLTDIKSITIYGAETDGSDGIAVIHTTAAVEQMIDALRKKEQSLTTLTVNGLTLYTWDDHGMKRYAHVRPGPRESERIVIVSAERARILAGIAVMAGEAAALTRATDGPVASSPKGGSVIYAAMNKLPNREAMPLKNAESFVFDVGEAKGEVYADLLVNAKSSTDAKNLTQVMQGGLALMRMAASGGEHVELRELSALADGITFSSEESCITASFRYDAEKLSACLKGLSEIRDRLNDRDTEHRKTRKDAGNTGR